MNFKKDMNIKKILISFFIIFPSFVFASSFYLNINKIEFMDMPSYEYYNNNISFVFATGTMSYVYLYKEDGLLVASSTIASSTISYPYNLDLDLSVLNYGNYVLYFNNSYCDNELLANCVASSIPYSYLTFSVDSEPHEIIKILDLTDSDLQRAVYYLLAFFLGIQLLLLFIKKIW